MGNRHCSLAYTSALEALRTQSRALLKQVEPLQSEDLDAVHDMRVASRRVRAIIAEYGDLFADPGVKVLREHARAITRGLSKARELDVSMGIVEGLRKELHGSPRYAANHALRMVKVLRSMESASIHSTASLVAAPQFAEDLQKVAQSFGKRRVCLVKRAVKSTTRRYEDVVAVYREWENEFQRGNPSMESLHGLRIAFKKLRYTSEIYREAYSPEMVGFIQQLKDVQDWLGDWHDYAVVRNLVERTRACAPAKAAEGMGALCAILDEKIGVLLGGFMEHVEAFFAPARQEEVTRLLSSLKHDCCWSGSALSAAS
jgi:CHAD domain-containing protein